MPLGHTIAGRDFRTRYVTLGVFMIGGLLVLAVQLYRLQIARHKDFEAKSVANSVREVRITADRGMIKDSRGTILVDNRPSFNLFITPAFCQKCREEVLPQLASWLSWDPTQVAKVEAQLKDAVLTGAQFQLIPVEIDLTRDEFDVVNAHAAELPGVVVQDVPHRNYRVDPLREGEHGAGQVGLAHMLGYMNEINKPELEKLNKELERAQKDPRLTTNVSQYALGDFIGRRGLERFYERKLRGVDGIRKEVVDAKGKVIEEFDRKLEDKVISSRPGNNLILSIDLRLQLEAERAFPGTAGAVVVVDVRTGFLLAVVSRPAFDPNMLTGRVTPAEMLRLSQDRLQPMVNRVAAQQYSPGSTFKVVTALAALRSKSFTPSTSTFCTGGYRLGNRVWRCWKDAGHGQKDSKGALQHSCDTYYYKVADTLGLDPIAAMGKELGLGSLTGIGVVAEVPGIMPDTTYHDRVTPGGYTKGMALNSAIGQGDDNVTPLQLAMLYTAIANRGQVYQPQLVKRIESVDGKILEEFHPKLIRKIEFDPEHLQLVTDALSAVVNEAGGTAFGNRLKDVKVAGKTGTAQVAKLGAVRLKTHQMDYWLRDHAWFASFAPAENPEIAVVVLNEHGGHGSSDAAPTAMAVIQKYFDLKKEDANASGPPMNGMSPDAGEPQRSMAHTQPAGAP